MDHDPVEVLVFHNRHGFSTGCHVDDVDIGSRDGGDDFASFCVIGANHQQLLYALLDGLFDGVEGFGE